MRSVHRYANYSARELATEPEFINWVYFPNENSDRFWAEYLVQYPLQSNEVNTARFIVMQMRIVEDSMPEQNAVETWEKIRSRIELNSDRSKSAVVLLRRWVAAAAVLLLLASAAFLVWKKASPAKDLAVNRSTPQIPENDVAPGGNKAILTLADGTEVILDSANNGAITKQGNVTVIKLDDGQLAYNPSTTQPLNASTITYNTVTTPRGGQYQLVLSDGTKVWLNAASSLKFPTAFVGSERKVEMTGEGYFEVAASHDPSGAKRGFIVSAAGMDVEVLGTHFNINAYADEAAVKTTLLEGKVRVSGNGQAVILLPGKQASMDPSGLTIREADLEQVMAWKNGRFLFNSTDIKIVMRQIARWYDVDVSYSNQIEGTISGNIARSENIGQIKKLLEATGKIDFEINGKNITVKAK